MTFKTLFTSNIDAILIDAYSTQNFIYLRIVSKIAALRAIDYYPMLHGGNLPARLKSHPKIGKRIFTNSKKNISPSLYLQDFFLKEGFDNTVYIPNSIDMLDYKFVERKSIEPNILWVRAFAKIYNPLLALTTLKSLLVTYPKATLTMVGPKRDESYEECIAFAKAEQLPVTFTGKLSKQEWINIAQRHDLFLNTTDFDNMPVSLIEAMALGIPIISTNVGGIPYLIEHEQEGLLVNSNASSEMLNGIKSLIENPGLVSVLSQQGRKKAETFNWEIVKSKWKKTLS